MTAQTTRDNFFPVNNAYSHTNNRMDSGGIE